MGMARQRVGELAHRVGCNGLGVELVRRKGRFESNLCSCDWGMVFQRVSDTHCRRISVS